MLDCENSADILTVIPPVHQSKRPRRCQTVGSRKFQSAIPTQSSEEVFSVPDSSEMDTDCIQHAQSRALFECPKMSHHFRHHYFFLNFAKIWQFCDCRGKIYQQFIPANGITILSHVFHQQFNIKG